MPCIACHDIGVDGGEHLCALHKAADDLLAACKAALAELQRFADAPATSQVQQHWDTDTTQACVAISDAIAKAENLNKRIKK